VSTSVTRSQEETERLAEALAARLHAGDVLLLSGPLGAGKTAFVRGIARGFGIDPDDVSSPTFTLLHEYRGGRLRLFHADLYRLGRGGAADLGLDDPAVQEGVLAVEWPDRLAQAVPGAIAITFAIVDERSREVRIESGPAAGAPPWN
jgi:tRNA threonylcarbamoyladenosine biosynthesis protein TsaE